MADLDSNDSNDDRKRIVIQENGPYTVYGNIPLVRKTQVVSEYGEPLTWQTGKRYRDQRHI